MNAHAMTDKLASDLASEFGGKVIDFNTPNPEKEVEKLADVHRRLVAKYSQRQADNKKALKARLAGLEGDRKALRAAFDRDLHFISERIAEAKDKAERDTQADKKLIAASKAALDSLMAE